MKVFSQRIYQSNYFGLASWIRNHDSNFIAKILEGLLFPING